MTKSNEISPELRGAMKSLRLGQQIPTLADRIGMARKQQLDVEQFLVMLFTDEVSRRQSHSTQRRAQKAGLDPEMVFERWDETSDVTYDRRTLQELTSLRFLEGHNNLAVLGPVGVGKTFIANALGYVACRSGFGVQLYRA